jgi:hypothetical protein
MRERSFAELAMRDRWKVRGRGLGADGGWNLGSQGAEETVHVGQRVERVPRRIVNSLCSDSELE